jgi:divalent metal cation (Fe/Co/Zn/Cd) transporter
MESGSVRAVIYALGANAMIAVAKYAAAFATGSHSMVAEAVHSTADCGNQLLLLFGMRQAKRPPSSEYPLGFGKEQYFWSFVVALMLFSVGGLFSVYEGCSAWAASSRCTKAGTSCTSRARWTRR